MVVGENSSGNKRRSTSSISRVEAAVIAIIVVAIIRIISGLAAITIMTVVITVRTVSPAVVIITSVLAAAVRGAAVVLEVAVEAILLVRSCQSFSFLRSAFLCLRGPRSSAKPLFAGMDFELRLRAGVGNELLVLCFPFSYLVCGSNDKDNR